MKKPSKFKIGMNVKVVKAGGYSGHYAELNEVGTVVAFDENGRVGVDLGRTSKEFHPLNDTLSQDSGQWFKEDEIALAESYNIGLILSRYK